MNRGSERALSRAACSKAAFNVGATAIRNSAFFISVFRASDGQFNALALYTNFLSEAARPKRRLPPLQVWLLQELAEGEEPGLGAAIGATKKKGAVQPPLGVSSRWTGEGARL